MKLAIAIPAKDSSLLADLIKGSAIVCPLEAILQSDPFTAYFEGNLYHADNLLTFEDRAICAAGRLAVKYPTVAKKRVVHSDLIIVGEIDCNDAGIVSSITIHTKALSLVESWTAKAILELVVEGVDHGNCRINYVLHTDGKAGSLLCYQLTEADEFALYERTPYSEPISPFPHHKALPLTSPPKGDSALEKNFRNWMTRQLA